MDRTCETLSPAEIIEINRQAIENFGGLSFAEPSNLKNENSLLYILEAIHTTYFGVELYPTILDKAAAVGWTIITGHVFNDANKRTGMLALQIFLELNGFDLQISGLPLDEDVIRIAERTAEYNEKPSEGISKEGFTDWVKGRAIKF